MAFPSTLSSFTHPSPSDKLNSPSHSALHNAVSSAVGQIEVIIGTDASTLGTIIGDLRNVTSGGGGHVQTANKGGTGQTTFAKGDLLVATSSSVLSRFAVGTDGQFLVANSSVASGIQWGAGGTPTVRVYASGGVGAGGSSLIALWSKPSTLSYAVIEVVGGGGGGGGSTTSPNACGGGGGGGYSRKTVSAASLPITASVVSGLGGIAGAQTGGTGGTGGVTWFGSVLSATGGTGGADGAGAGIGGLGVSGDANSAGGGGGAGSTTIGVPSGTGGSTYFGGGALGIIADSAGADGRPYGGGGSGAKSGGADRAGGAGADGVIIVYEY